PASPGVNFVWVQARTGFGLRTLPVFLVRNISVLTFQIEAPAMITAEKLITYAVGDPRAGEDIKQKSAAMGTNIVINTDPIWRAHDNDRVIQHFKCYKIAGLRNFFDTPGLKPYLAP